MMRSLSSAVGGLRSHQTKMDVIGNNIANVNTYGFKSSRASFSDVYYQTLSKGSTPTTALGGTNPTQIGYGAVVATVDVMNSVSGPTSTDRALDVYINGDGMIATKDANGNLLYSRLGILGFDAAGNLVDSNGNFVMGFPVDKDGNPIIRPDGTVDVQDLARITAEPEMLDQLTSISIGPTGEIIGTMPGDTSVTLNNKRPDWLVDVVTEDEVSNILGDIKVTMEYTSKSQSNLPADWITKLEAKSNSMVEGEYTFTYEDGVIKAVGSQKGDMYTGTYKAGASVNLVNAKGEVAFVLDTDRYVNPAEGDTGKMTFGLSQTLTVDFADKGGNRYSQSLEYTGQTEMLFDPDPGKNLGVTLILDPDAVESKEIRELKYTTSNAFATGADAWLQNVMLNKDAVYGLGNVSLAAGVKQTIALQTGVLDSLNFLDETAVEKLIKALNQSGSYKLQTTTTGAQTVVEILLPDGKKISSAPLVNPQEGDAITFTADSNGDPIPGGPFTIGELQPEHFKTTYAATDAVGANFYSDTGLNKNAILSLFDDDYTGDYKVKFTYNDNGGDLDLTTHDFTLQILDDNDDPVATITGNGAATDLIDTVSGTKLGTLSKLLGAAASVPQDGTTVTLGNVAATTTGNFEFSGKTLARLTERNTFQLIDTSSSPNKILEEVAYSGSNRITLGDLTLQVDKAKMDAFFLGRPLIEDNVEPIGEIVQGQETDWIFDGNSAFAQAGVGEALLIGNIALAKIPNMAGMVQNGDSYFVTSPNSGNASFAKPGINETGTLTAGYLEMSNVEIAKEFTDMITTQRGFQANTRIITVSDEMLNELVNLKR